MAGARAHAHRCRRRRRTAQLLLALCVLAAAAGVPGASAIVQPAVTIDGPSQDIAGFGGVAMAADGTGGLVYLKRVEGVVHVFVSRYVDRRWQPPIRVDTAQPYAASWPRIGAADGGELEVVWATPVAIEETHTVLELLSATLHPGAGGFGPAKLVDPDIRYGVGTSPDLALSSTGQGDVVYRVVEPSSGSGSGEVSLLRPGDVVEQVRVAHFEGETWSRLGVVNRDPDVSMRAPTEVNAPRVAVGPTGNGVVVWQEPDIDGVARIWARRIFGRSLDYAMPVSATSWNGKPISDDADAPSVAVSATGQAEVAYRQTVSPGSPLRGPRIFLNTLPDGLSEDGTQFTGAVVADEAVPGGAAATVGPPAIDTDNKNDIRLLYAADGSAREIAGTAGDTSPGLTLGPFVAATEPAPASVVNPEGGGVAAWPSANAEGPAIAIREDFPGGGAQTALVRGGVGGPIDGLGAGTSGAGDGLVGLMQGPLGDAAIAAAVVTAPPAEFPVAVPPQWVRASQAVISWSPAPDPTGPVEYALVRDGRVQPVTPGATQARIDPRGLSSGVHTIQVLATDSEGQTALTLPRELRIDDQPPSVAVRRVGRDSVAVAVVDRLSGVDSGSVSVSFGDGHSARGRARLTHRYAGPGSFTIVVRASDRAGNRSVVRRLVRLP